MRRVADGFGLVESPRWHDRRFWFADWTSSEIRMLDDDGSSQVVVRHRSLPLCFDFLPDGTMLVVSSATTALLRLGSDGELSPYADLSPLSALGANDIVVDGRGNAYVNSNDAEFGAPAPTEGPAPGRIYLVPHAGEPRLVADDLAFPNGMAVTADNRTLIVAESYRSRLTAFDIADDGSLSGRRRFADLGQDPPDGITCDADGAVWYADVPHGHCVRVAEGGRVLATVDLDRGAFGLHAGRRRRADPARCRGAVAWRGRTDGVQHRLARMHLDGPSAGFTRRLAWKLAPRAEQLRSAEPHRHSRPAHRS